MRFHALVGGSGRDTDIVPRAEPATTDVKVAGHYENVFVEILRLFMPLLHRTGIAANEDRISGPQRFELDARAMHLPLAVSAVLHMLAGERGSLSLHCALNA